MQTVEADDYTLYYHNLARLAHKSGRFDLVITAWQNALEVNPNDDVARVHLDRELREYAEIKVSILEGEQKLVDAPDDVQTRYRLAHNYLGAGYVTEAKAEWERIAAMKQENWSESALKMIRKHCLSAD